MDAEATWAKRFAVIFLIQAVIAVCALSFLMPPLANSDEMDHLKRVDQIAHGGLVAHREAGDRYWSGGTVDDGIAEVGRIVRSDDPARVRAAGKIRWGQRAPSAFPNTSIYPPILYGPAVAGEWLGRAFGLSIVGTLKIARLVSGLVFVLVISAAIARSAGAAPWLLAIASLPMSVSLLAAVSQDGGLLACAFAAVALVARIGADGDARADRRRIACLALALALVASARPVYAPFAIIPLLVRGGSIRARAAASAAVLAAILLWSAIDTIFVITNWAAFLGADPKGQILFLLGHPWRIGPIAVATFAGPQGMHGQPYWQEAIGALGALDIVLPTWFYHIGACGLTLAGLLAMLRARPMLSTRSQAVAATAGLASVALVFVFQYVDVMRVGAPKVGAVQGRYFLPIGIVLPLALPALGCPPYPKSSNALRLVIAAFPTVAMLTAIMCVLLHTRP
jgi:uncharacterized membrane protein